MRFLWKIWLPAIGLFFISFGIKQLWGPTMVAIAVGEISLVWMIADVPITGCYLLYRLVYSARRDVQQR
jgi:hypothetical protein